MGEKVSDGNLPSLMMGAVTPETPKPHTMNYQIIFYNNEQDTSINHVDYLDYEPSDQEVISLMSEHKSDYAEVYEDINEDDEYKNCIASYGESEG